MHSCVLFGELCFHMLIMPSLENTLLSKKLAWLIDQISQFTKRPRGSNMEKVKNMSVLLIVYSTFLNTVIVNSEQGGGGLLCRGTY